MTEFQLDLVDYIKALPDEDNDCPNPSEKSTVLFRVLHEDHRDRPTVDIYAYEGGGADYEDNYGPGLDYTVEGVLEDGIKEGFYVIEGLYMVYSTDYCGDVDADTEFDNMRPAEQKDWYHFGVKPEDGGYEL